MRYTLEPHHAVKPCGVGVLCGRSVAAINQGFGSSIRGIFPWRSETTTRSIIFRHDSSVTKALAQCSDIHVATQETRNPTVSPMRHKGALRSKRGPRARVSLVCSPQKIPRLKDAVAKHALERHSRQSNGHAAWPSNALSNSDPTLQNIGSCFVVRRLPCWTYIEWLNYSRGANKEVHHRTVMQLA